MKHTLSDEFERYRGRSFAIAYRMLGGVAEAEDIVQEAWLRWQRAEGVESSSAWLTTTVTRLCLDHLKSARVRREEYVGPWVPEPLDTSRTEVDRETISTAFLLLLERLSPAERAVYLLHEVFDVDYEEIATVLEKTPAAVRQLYHRASGHIQTERPRYAASKEQHMRLLSAFMMAVQQGEVAGIEALLADDARSWSDGGGKTRAALKIVYGRTRVAKFFAGVMRKGRHEGLLPEPRELNGFPALVLYRGSAPEMALMIETDDEKIHSVHTVLNPEKLARLGPAQWGTVAGDAGAKSD